MLTKKWIPLLLALLVGSEAFAIEPTGHKTYFGNTLHYYPKPIIRDRNVGYPNTHFRPYYQTPPTRFWYDPYYGRYINGFDPGYWRFQGLYNGAPLNRYPYNRFIEPYNPYR